MASQKSLENFVISASGVNKVKCVFADVNKNYHDHDEEDSSIDGDYVDIGTFGR